MIPSDRQCVCVVCACITARRLFLPQKKREKKGKRKRTPDATHEAHRHPAHTLLPRSEREERLEGWAGRIQNGQRVIREEAKAVLKVSVDTEIADGRVIAHRRNVRCLGGGDTAFARVWVG